MRFPTHKTPRKRRIYYLRKVWGKTVSLTWERRIPSCLLLLVAWRMDGGGKQKVLLCDKVREKRVVGFLLLLLLLLLLPGEFETLERRGGKGRREKSLQGLLQNRVAFFATQQGGKKGKWKDFRVQIHCSF